ncbi:Xaa-Pro peptidase family protein [Cupriavidus metallidurans]|uniref:M24 family metallopeptidase n=1 Tax=Cupriavidus TaxID=106589 RepID=UPI0002A42F4A|nr:MULTISPECIES: Xaa-Pro peptidase family protein [Cupriavidus]EKZ95682.1 metalloprotease/Xaa-Pro dipeptidase type M24 [Cupriavidus sp. HMR-1]GMG94154.1 Xaa-Pro dipeptidase [Cupriavidus sp. TKC]HBO78639.1 aminopeptidase P family protein [Cupriavidus sp.]
MPHLTKAVHDYRLAAMHRLMDRLRVDALVFGSPDFFQYATNFQLDVWPWERPVFVVVPRNGETFAVMNELSTNHMRFAAEKGTVWLSDVTYYAEHPRVANRLALPSQLPEVVAALLAAKGLGMSRIAVDVQHPILTGAQRYLPEMTLRPAMAEMRSLRWVKHAEELQTMRDLAALTDWVQDRYRENIRPGRLVQELDHAMAALMVEEAARRFAGEDFEIMKCWTLTGPASASPHGDGAACGSRIAKGDTIVNLVLPRLNGLYVENERTWFCGQPSDEQARFYSVAALATDAAVAAAVVGRRVCDMDAAAQAVIESAGCGDYVFHRTGHAVGLMLHEYPEDMAFNTRPLLAGEVYSSEPGLYVYGLGGFRLDDTVVVGEVPEVMVKTPKTLSYATVSL